jgi:two-component system, chemotaxis family, response regulator WspR
METTQVPRSAPAEIQAVVLLVDQQAGTVEAVRQLLAEHRDIEFHACTDAARAEEFAMEVLPTCILQDLEIGNANGLALVRRYRVNSALRDVPVIILSSRDDAKSKVEAFRFGANDYVVKLPSSMELAARVRYHSQAYVAAQQRQAVFRALQEGQRALKARNQEIERQKALLEEQAIALEKANRELAESAFTDPLTGLHNRRYFKTHIEPELRAWTPDKRMSKEGRQRRQDGDERVLFLFDLDHFKQINDSYGHDAGDVVLVEVGRRLRATLRHDDALMRWGGEEFLVATQFSQRDTAHGLATRILSALADQPIVVPSGHALRVTASIGWAAFPWNRQSPQAVQLEDVIFMADTAVYLSKRGGRNRATGVLPNSGEWPAEVRRAGKAAPDQLAVDPLVRLQTTLGPAAAS